MTLLKAFDSKVSMAQELLRLSSSASMHSGIVLRDTSVTAVIRSQILYSKIFDKSNEVCHQEACVAENAMALVL